MIDNHMFRVVGRLKPGIPAAQGVADVSLLSRRLHEAHLDMPFVQKGARGRPLLEHMVGDLKRPLYVLLAATGCLLLIACINVANMLVARAVARRKDMAIRTALGGGRLRLLRERLMEAMLLSAAGGALGPLGAAQGPPYPIGRDGLGQNFAGGKIFYSPDTGANVKITLKRPRGALAPRRD